MPTTVRAQQIPLRQGSDTTTWSYDLAGILSSRTAGRGIVTTYTPDPAERLQSVAYNNSDPGVSFQYDTYGRVSQMTDRAGTTLYSYDDGGRRRHGLCTARSGRLWWAVRVLY